MDISNIFTDDPSGAKLVELAKSTATQLVRENLTRAQIRNIFTEVRKIEALWSTKRDDAMRRLNMLKPKLDYQAARSTPVGRLRDLLIPAIDEVGKAATDEERDRRFSRFMDLFEAILAYHRAQGGRN
jgi:CRISPR-associated protein Csm2